MIKSILAGCVLSAVLAMPAFADVIPALHDALLTVEDGRKLPWFGPPMSAPSMATARLMETWAHGLDVADALGVTRAPTARLRSIAHIGVRTRDFAYTVHGLTPPAEPFHVKLRAPDGSEWTWGPQDAAQQVSGSAEHFCMLVTQRRARSELDVVAVGPDAATNLIRRTDFTDPEMHDLELLAGPSVPFSAVAVIGVPNDRVRQSVKAVLKDHGGHAPRVAVFPPWFVPPVTAE